ncbi:MAG: precorrin-2 C20-methyltransferase, partial [Dehalococcoidia bacterium]|nr:precorrin-2 C20-methyltransferase [Dehalococcoidia bacterium]
MVANEQFHNTGKLYGVGVGPGDPQLITLKAYNVLRQAPVVCVPQGNPGEAGYTWNIIKDLLNDSLQLSSGSRQEILNLHFPMTYNAQELHKYWGQATEAIWQRLSTGLDCVFVTEGDPLLYGTFIHVYRLIRERYPQVAIEIIPGISSILAAAASAQIPLAEGEESVAILPATASYETLKLTLSRFDTIVLLKVNR